MIERGVNPIQPIIITTAAMWRGSRRRGSGGDDWLDVKVMTPPLRATARQSVCTHHSDDCGGSEASEPPGEGAAVSLLMKITTVAAVVDITITTHCWIPPLFLLIWNVEFGLAADFLDPS